MQYDVMVAAKKARAVHELQHMRVTCLTFRFVTPCRNALSERLVDVVGPSGTAARHTTPLPYMQLPTPLVLQFQYEDVVAEQAARGGIIIIRALYGDMAQLQRPDVVEVEHVPDTIDVTIPVQILVQRTVNPANNREVMKIELSGGCVDGRCPRALCVRVS